MIIASAQTKPHRGNIAKNLDDHYHFIELAAQHGVQLIAFPEMSITGYEHELAIPLAFKPNDECLSHLKHMAGKHQMIIIAGAPIEIDGKMYIGSFVLKPDGSEAIYTKHFLHPGEEVVYHSSFNYNPQIQLEKELISLAICADIDHPEHACNAGLNKSTIYIPSIFFSPQGIPEAHQVLSEYARLNRMAVLMSNFAGESWGRPAGGQSAFWDSNGNLVLTLDDANQGLLIVDKSTGEWKCKAIHVS